jgi:hypothetical protein
MHEFVFKAAVKRFTINGQNDVAQRDGPCSTGYRSITQHTSDSRSKATERAAMDNDRCTAKTK